MGLMMRRAMTIEGGNERDHHLRRQRQERRGYRLSFLLEKDTVRLERIFRSTFLAWRGERHYLVFLQLFALTRSHHLPLKIGGVALDSLTVDPISGRIAVGDGDLGKVYLL